MEGKKGLKKYENEGKRWI